MQKTEHYALNQWELSDRIIMEDFNADNARLDAALDGLKEADRYVHLRTVVTTEDLHQLDLDLSDIDWSVYPQIILTVKGEGSNSTLGYLRMNGDAENHYKIMADTAAETITDFAGYFYVNCGLTRSFSRITISGDCSTPQCQFFNAGRYVSTETYIYTGSDGFGATLETLNLIKSPNVEDNVFLAGLTINIYGVKF